MHFWLGLRSAFPSAEFTTRTIVIGREDPMMPPRAAVRWSTGRANTTDGEHVRKTHRCAEVHVMGITHVEYGPWGLRREWTH